MCVAPSEPGAVPGLGVLSPLRHSQNPLALPSPSRREQTQETELPLAAVSAQGLISQGEIYESHRAFSVTRSSLELN